MGTVINQIRPFVMEKRANVAYIVTKVKQRRPGRYASINDGDTL